jgi:hypothetical protein
MTEDAWDLRNSVVATFARPSILPSPPLKMSTRPKIWWSNAIFFISVHIATVIGLYYKPFYAVDRATLILSLVIWQLADFGLVKQHNKTSTSCLLTLLVLLLVIIVSTPTELSAPTSLLDSYWLHWVQLPFKALSRFVSLFFLIS